MFREYQEIFKNTYFHKTSVNLLSNLQIYYNFLNSYIIIRLPLVEMFFIVMSMLHAEIIDYYIFIFYILHINEAVNS